MHRRAHHGEAALGQAADGVTPLDVLDLDHLGAVVGEAADAAGTNVWPRPPGSHAFHHCRHPSPASVFRAEPSLPQPPPVVFRRGAARGAIDRRGRVLVVAMEREAKRNAVDRQLADELDAALNLLDDDPDLWAGVLTGTPTCSAPGAT